MTEEPAATREKHSPRAAKAAARKHRGRRRLPVFTEVLLAILAVALVQAFVVKPFGVPSSSMENTLHIGDRIVVNRLDDTIKRADIVVFGHGLGWNQKQLPPPENPVFRAIKAFGDLTGIGPSNTAYTVKRVIGLPGETVKCCSADGAVEVNGEPLTEPYVWEDLPFTPGSLTCTTTPRSSRCFPPITVPKDNYLVLGDHRSQSADSVIGCRGSVEGGECAKFVPKERIVGPVSFRIWPLNAIGNPTHPAP